MSKIKHTPGPWEYVSKLTASENHRGFFVRAEKVTRNGKWALAEVQPGDEDGKLGEANARLIAAAPDLLEMLQAATPMLILATHEAMKRSDVAFHDRLTMTRIAVEAAIAKATGEQP